MFHNCFNNSAFTSRVFYFLHNVLMHRFKCFINMSLAIGLELEWKILRSFLFLYPKTNTDGSLKFINSLNNFLNLFLIMGLLLISCNSGLKRFKILILQLDIQLSEELVCITSRYLIRCCQIYLKQCSNFSNNLVSSLNLEFSLSQI